MPEQHEAIPTEAITDPILRAWQEGHDTGYDEGYERGLAEGVQIGLNKAHIWDDNTPLTEVELTNRTRNALRRAGKTTLSELGRTPLARLQTITHLGHAGIVEIYELLGGIKDAQQTDEEPL